MNNSFEFVLNIVKDMATNGNLTDSQQDSLCDAIITTVLFGRENTGDESKMLKDLFLGYYINSCKVQK